MCGSPMRLNTTRRSAFASVTVPTVERTFAPIRSWSRMIAVVRPSSESTSGRASVGMKPCTKALYVSLISRCDSAAIVPKTRELLPEPEMPVNAVSRRFGISRSMPLRLFTRAPRTRITSWLSASCTSVLGHGRELLLGVAVPPHPLQRVLPAPLHGRGRFLVIRVAGGDHVLEVAVLGLDHLVGAAPVVLEVAGAAQ